MSDAHAILLKILAEYKDADKWVGQPFEHIKRISNSKVGDVGQDLIEALCHKAKFECSFPLNSKGKRARQSPWDIRIEQISFELKTATEDINGSFQFNHIRYHREYDALMCIGISPDNIYMKAWSKADVATGRAGNLVSMEKGANASYKLTKRATDLLSIDDFEGNLLDFITKPRT